jgi:hypothetical protein
MFWYEFHLQHHVDTNKRKEKIIFLNHIKHTINAGHHGKPPNLHQTISPGSYKSALASEDSTECKGLVFVFIELRLIVFASVISISVSSIVGLLNTNCGSCFERRGRFRDGDSEVRMRETDDQYFLITCR